MSVTTITPVLLALCFAGHLFVQLYADETCQKCPPNEEYVSCMQGVCRALNCTQRGEYIPCPDCELPPEQCDAGCICEEGYLRGPDGCCMPEEQCDDICPNPHEEYRLSRSVSCPKLDTCISIVARIICTKNETAGCVCEEGYKRLEEGSPCIPQCECPELRNTQECLTEV